MSNAYDDAKYGVIRRQWFGLINSWGGDGGTTGVTFGSATVTTHVKGWYPPGPIKIKKVGYLVMCTMVGKATNKGRRRFKFYTRGASASVICATANASAGTVAARTIASVTTFTVSQCKKGEYISIKSATPVTVCTTWALSSQTQGTVNGTVAFFIDWYPTYGASWDTP
jgi:hypothetical protein